MADRKDEERELQEFADDIDVKKDLRALNEGVDAQRTNDPLDPLNWPFGLKVSLLSYPYFPYMTLRIRIIWCHSTSSGLTTLTR